MNPDVMGYYPMYVEEVAFYRAPWRTETGKEYLCREHTIFRESVVVSSLVLSLYPYQPLLGELRRTLLGLSDTICFTTGAKEEWNEDKREKKKERSTLTSTLHLQPKCEGQPAQ